MNILRSRQHSRRSVAVLAASVLLLGSLTGIAGEPGGTERKTVTIPVEGMACMSCAATVKRTVKAIDGVSEVHVNLVGRSVRLAYVPGVASPERIAATISSLGYKAGLPVEVK